MNNLVYYYSEFFSLCANQMERVKHNRLVYHPTSTFPSLMKNFSSLSITRTRVYPSISTMLSDKTCCLSNKSSKYVDAAESFLSTLQRYIPQSPNLKRECKHC